MKKTKVVCTMGPNTNDREVMRKLIQNGMDVARFNFSHGDHEEQKFRMDLLKELREEEHAHTAILLDTKGPEIRTGLLKDGKKVTLRGRNAFVLTMEDIVGDETKVSLSYKGLVEDVEQGTVILIDDGLIGLKVKEITGQDICLRSGKRRRTWREKKSECAECTGENFRQLQKRIKKTSNLVWSRRLILLQHLLYAMQNVYWRFVHF